MHVFEIREMDLDQTGVELAQIAEISSAEDVVGVAIDDARRQIACRSRSGRGGIFGFTGPTTGAGTPDLKLQPSRSSRPAMTA